MRESNKSPLKAGGIFLFFACCLVFFSYQTLAEAGGPVLVRDQQLTIHSKNTPLKEILQTISEQSGVVIVYYGTTDKPVNLELNSIPLDEGIRKVLSGCNFSFLYQKSDSSDSESDIVLSRVTVISEGGSSSAPVYFGAEPVEESPPIIPDIPVREPVSTAAIEQIDNNDGLGRSPEGPSFTRTERDTFKQISRGEITSQLSAREVDISPNGKGRVADNQDFQEQIKGIQITSLERGSFLSQLGLKSGDIVRDINGARVSNSEQLADEIQKAVSGLGSGTILRIEVERDNNLEPIYVDMK